MIRGDVRRQVEERAERRCEYCRIVQEAEPFSRFHVEHIVARQHGGLGDLGNLALSCHHCNLHKGPNLAGLDPVDGALIRLFHPRLEDWNAHFELVGAAVVGRSPCGRATVQLLRMNARGRQALRLP